MAFKKGNYSSGGKSTFRRKKRRRAKPMTVRRVRRIAGTELKYSRTTNEINVNPISGNLIAFTSPISQGVLVTNRVGNWLQPVNLHGHIVLTGVNHNEADQITEVRWGCFRWMEDDSVASPSIPDLLEDSANPDSPFKFASKGKFKILYTRVATVVNDHTNSQFTKRFRYYIKLSGGSRTMYDNATPRKNQLYFFALSDAAVGDEPTLKITNTLRYTDG